MRRCAQCCYRRERPVAAAIRSCRAGRCGVKEHCHGAVDLGRAGDRLVVVSLVLLPLAGVSTTGAGGGVVSTVKVLILESTLVLPSASAAVALTVCDPSINDGIAVNVQLPAPSAVVMPADAPSKNTVTRPVALAVPVTVACCRWCCAICRERPPGPPVVRYPGCRSRRCWQALVQQPARYCRPDL